MTAIDKFIRLEAVGWWFEAGRQEAREVVVSFGDATLQIASLKDEPLTHWALLATKRVGTRGDAVIYSADPEQHEVLEIEDRDMIRAISAVSLALEPPKEKAKWRRWVRRGIGLGALLALLWGGPVLVSKATTLLTPPARVAALSDSMAQSLRAEFGTECQGWLGLRALEGFSSGLMPDTPVTLLVFEQQTTAAIALPNAVSLSKAALQAATSPDELAALVVAYWAMGQNRRPLAAYVASLGPVDALKGLLTGRFPEGAKAADIAPDGQDYLTARAFLQSRGLSAFALQNMAKQDGIGLPLGPVIAESVAFTFDAFEALQNICDE